MPSFAKRSKGLQVALGTMSLKIVVFLVRVPRSLSLESKSVTSHPGGTRLFWKNPSVPLGLGPRTGPIKMSKDGPPMFEGNLSRSPLESRPSSFSVLTNKGLGFMGLQFFSDGLLLGFPEAFDDDVDATEILQAQVAHKDLLDTLA